MYKTFLYKCLPDSLKTVSISHLSFYLPLSSSKDIAFPNTTLPTTYSKPNDKMKFTTFFSLLPIVLAAPGQPIQAGGTSEFKRDLPNLTPVNVPDFDSSFDISCGKQASSKSIQMKKRKMVTTNTSYRQNHCQGITNPQGRIMGHLSPARQ